MGSEGKGGERERKGENKERNNGGKVNDGEKETKREANQRGKAAKGEENHGGSKCIRWRSEGEGLIQRKGREREGKKGKEMGVEEDRKGEG